MTAKRGKRRKRGETNIDMEGECNVGLKFGSYDTITSFFNNVC